MPSLDLFTLACVTIVNLLISSTAMYGVALLNRQRSGIRDCAIGGFIVAGAFFLSLLRSLSPNNGLNLVSNLMIVGGTLLLLEGIRSFRGMKRLKPALTTGGFALFAALFALWLYRFDSVQARTILASLTLSLLFYWCAYCMASHAEHGDRGSTGLPAAFTPCMPRRCWRAASCFRNPAWPKRFSRPLLSTCSPW